MITINDVITAKYDNLKALCKTVNRIQRVEKKEGIKDIEEIDYFHTLLLRFVKKYKGKEFDSIEEGYYLLKNKIKMELKFIWNEKPDSFSFCEINERVHDYSVD